MLATETVEEDTSAKKEARRQFRSRRRLLLYEIEISLPNLLI
jgi:hypothetical protein